MPAYLVVEHIITDPAKFEEYRTKVGPLIAAYGGRYLTKGATVACVYLNQVTARQTSTSLFGAKRSDAQNSDSGGRLAAVSDLRNRVVKVRWLPICGH